jgi:hypothetical protein
MSMNNIGDVVFDAMLKEAVIADFRAEMEAMPSEEEILRDHPYSEEHNRRMKALFASERRRTAVARLWSFAKAAVIFISVFATLAFALLMTNPEVTLTGIINGMMKP